MHKATRYLGSAVLAYGAFLASSSNAIAQKNVSQTASIPYVSQLEKGVLNKLSYVLSDKNSKFQRYNKKHDLSSIVMGTKLKDSTPFSFTAISSPFNKNFLSIRFIYGEEPCQYFVSYGPKTEEGFDDDKEPYQVVSGARVFGKNEKQNIQTLDEKCRKRYEIEKTEVNARFMLDLKHTLEANTSPPEISEKTSK